MATHKEESRAEWTGNRTIETINSGSLQRIADATEKMAGNYTSLQNDRDMYKRWYGEKVESIARLNRSNAALRGVITKLKRKKKS